MSEDEFKAPDWVSQEPEQQPFTRKQRIYFFIAVSIVVPFCLWAGWFEYTRAQEGHWRAWVYAFEWPFFAVVVIYLYRRFSRGDMPKIPRPNFSDDADNKD
jgi:hypothetical protein